MNGIYLEGFRALFRGPKLHKCSELRDGPTKTIGVDQMWLFKYWLVWNLKKVGNILPQNFMKLKLSTEILVEHNVNYEWFKRMCK